jgi:hypothetical protein
LTGKRVIKGLLRPFWVLLALIFLLEAWLWDRLAPLVAVAVNLVAWDRLKIRLAALVERLPPAVVLIVFVVPLLLLLPLKFLEIWLLAHHRWIAAILVLLLAKLLGLGVTAFVFEVTRDKLLQMAWFKRLYEWVLWLRDRAHAIVDPIKLQLKSALLVLQPARAGRFGRLLWRLRRRAQRVPPEAS